MNKRFIGFFNQTGASELLALAVASAIGAVVITATTTSFVKLNQGQQNIVKTADAFDIKREMEQMLSHPATCKANFDNLHANGTAQDTTMVQVDDVGIETERFRMNQPIPGFNIQIAQWNLVNGPIIRTWTPTRAVQQIVFLNLTINKGQQVEGPSTIVRTVKLWTQKIGDENSGIRFCYAVVGTGSDIWLRHVNQNNIFNTNDGNVGVGTDTPTAKLHVTATNPATANMRTSGPVTAPTFNALGNFNQNNAAFVNSVLGRMGMGQSNPAFPLDVAGNARFNGNLTISGNATAPSVTLQNNLAVGTNLTVQGATSLGALTTNGNSSFANSALFSGNAQFDSPTTMAQTLAVGGAPLGTAALSISGTMRTNGLVTAPRVNSDAFCIGSHCRTTFATQTCPLGSVTYRNNIDGTVGCSNITCPNGTFFRGIIGINQPDCQALPTPTCPTNTYITNYDAVTGVYTCQPIPPEVHVPNCASGYLVGVNGGVPVCVPTQLVGGPCGVGSAVVDINPDGTPVCDNVIANPVNCPNGQLATGIQATGAPICSSVALATSCGGSGQRLVSMGSNRAANCGSISIPGGNCPTGIKGISSTGTVTCF